MDNSMRADRPENMDGTVSDSLVNPNQNVEEAPPANNAAPGRKSRRKKQRQKEERGLPENSSLEALAKTYLEGQNRLWPELSSIGLLPAPSEAAIQEYAKRFKAQFLAGDVKHFNWHVASVPWAEIAAAYLRFSDENSNPRSLDQQLLLALERARKDNVFIPWDYVFADAAVTGTTAMRRGYQLAKACISDNETGVQRLYIDEIGRASRDAIEALSLGRLIEKCKKRLIGVSDNFDSDTQYSKLMLTLFAMLNEWFVDQLRGKVNRGMDDAFHQGKNLGPPALGCRLVPMTDAAGNPVYDDDGDLQRVKAIDEMEAEYVLLAFDLFVVQRKTYEFIAHRFNELKVGGSNSWTVGAIKQLLSRELYIGVEHYGMTYQVRDPETGKVTVVKRPREEWKTRLVPHLRILPDDDLWNRAQQRIAEISAVHDRKRKDRPSRATVNPKTLFRPVCSYCGNELILGHSGKYASFCCDNGAHRKNDCKLTTFKSVRIVDAAMLSHLRKAVITKERLKALRVAASKYLLEEAERPKEDTRPLLADIRKLEAKQKRLTKIVDDGGEQDLGSIVALIRKNEQSLRHSRARLKEVEQRNQPVPAPLEVAQVDTLLDDLPALLSQDVAVAAPILKDLTGVIEVEQDKTDGKRGADWVARFTANLVPVIVHLSRSRGCPTSNTWEFLNKRGWTFTEPSTVVIRQPLKYEGTLAKVAKLAARGACAQEIARLLGMPWEAAKSGLIALETGRPWTWRRSKRPRTSKRTKNPNQNGESRKAE